MGVFEEPTNHKELGEDKALVLRKVHYYKFYFTEGDNSYHKECALV